MYVRLLTNIEDNSMLTMYHDEYNFEVAKNHLSQASLFGGANVLVIKTEKKIPKKELQTLLTLCEKTSSNLFVYAYYGSDHKSYNNKKAFSTKTTMSVRFFNPKEYEAQNILLHVAQEQGVNIDKYTIRHLLQIHNFELSLCANEIEKFKIFDRAITTKDIDNLVYGLGEINLEQFIKKLINKQDFKDDLKNIIEHGEDEIRILTSITSYITQLYMFNIYIRVNGMANGMDILGYPAPKFVVDEKAQMSLKIKPKTYYKLHQILLESELKIKSYTADKSALLLSTLIRVQKAL